jgi:hypothetical protein
MTVADEKTRPTCGIVMPISELDGCGEQHWSEVREILDEAIEDAGFEQNLVSNADDVGIIQKRIIQNLYDNPVVVCDVSGKNPNVMFELGLRLAFDKPTIIVKDDKTSYSFDTSPIEHLSYPRDLRFSKIIEFKDKLSEKLRATYEKATHDPSFTTFLKHFGEFTVAKIDKKEVSGQEFVIQELHALRLVVDELNRRSTIRPAISTQRPGYVNVCLREVHEKGIAEALAIAKNYPSVHSVELEERSPDHKHIIVRMDSTQEEANVALRKILRDITIKWRKPIKSRSRAVARAKAISRAIEKTN